MISSNSYVQVGLVLAMLGGAFWLGQVSARLTTTEATAVFAAKQAAEVAENLAYTTATLDAIQKRLAAMP